MISRSVDFQVRSHSYNYAHISRNCCQSFNTNPIKSYSSISQTFIVPAHGRCQIFVILLLAAMTMKISSTWWMYVAQFYLHPLNSVVFQRSTNDWSDGNTQIYHQTVSKFKFLKTSSPVELEVSVLPLLTIWISYSDRKTIPYGRRNTEYFSGGLWAFWWQMLSWRHRYVTISRFISDTDLSYLSIIRIYHPYLSSVSIIRIYHPNLSIVSIYLSI